MSFCYTSRMRRLPRIPLLAGILLLCLAVAAPAQAADPDAREIIRKVQELLRADTGIARYTMRIVTPEWQREVSFDSWDDRLHKRFFIRILAPVKDADTTWLKDGSNLWMYLPRLERDIRIPPSMMLSSWMGSDFTNDDLVKMESVVDDYTHRLIAHDADSVTIESIPKPDAPVVWGKIVHVVGTDGIPRTEDYYDERGKHIRQLVFTDVREMDGRRIPSHWTIQPSDEPGKHTELILEKVRFNPQIPVSVFTRANLRRKGS